MKILITGTQGLAKELGTVLGNSNQVTLVSRSTGFDINNVAQWGYDFLDYDSVFNCAYSGYAQVAVLEFFYNAWKHDVSKQIVTVGSRAITFKRSEGEQGYWAYRTHKQTLQQAHDAMLLDAKCDMKIINPGPIDTAMIQHISCVKMDAGVLAQQIQDIANNPILKRVDLWL